VANQSIKLGPILTTDLEDVLESSVRHENHPGSLPFQEPVGCDGGTVKKSVILQVAQDLTAPLQNGICGILRGRWDLQCGEASIDEEQEVCKGPSSIHGQDGS
jgi:hypothetical protein